MSGVSLPHFSLVPSRSLPVGVQEDEEEEAVQIDNQEKRILSLFQNVSQEQPKNFSQFIPWFTREKKYALAHLKDQRDERIKKMNALLLGFSGLVATDPPHLQKAQEQFQKECRNWLSEDWGKKKWGMRLNDLQNSYALGHKELLILQLEKIRDELLSTSKCARCEIEAIAEHLPDLPLETNKRMYDPRLISILQDIYNSVLKHFNSFVDEPKPHLLPFNQAFRKARIACLANSPENLVTSCGHLCEHINKWKFLPKDEKVSEWLLKVLTAYIKYSRDPLPLENLKAISQFLRLLSDKSTAYLPLRLSLFAAWINQMQARNFNRELFKEWNLEPLFKNMLEKPAFLLKNIQGIKREHEKKLKKVCHRCESDTVIPKDSQSNIHDVCLHAVNSLTQLSTAFRTLIEALCLAIRSGQIGYLPPLMDALLPKQHPISSSKSSSQPLPEPHSLLRWAGAILIDTDLKRMELQRPSFPRDAQALKEHLKAIASILKGTCDGEMLLAIKGCLESFEKLPNIPKRELDNLRTSFTTQKRIHKNNLPSLDALPKRDIDHVVLSPFRDCIKEVITPLTDDQQTKLLDSLHLLKRTPLPPFSAEGSIEEFHSSSTNLLSSPTDYRNLMKKAIIECDMHSEKAHAEKDPTKKACALSAFRKMLTTLFEKIDSDWKIEKRFCAAGNYTPHPIRALSVMVKRFFNNSNPKAAWFEEIITCLKRIHGNAMIEQDHVDKVVNKILRVISEFAIENRLRPAFQSIVGLFLSEFRLKDDIMSKILGLFPGKESTDFNIQQFILESSLARIVSEDYEDTHLNKSIHYRETILADLTVFYLNHVNDLHRIDLDLVHAVIRFFHIQEDDWTPAIANICNCIEKRLNKLKKVIRKRIEAQKKAPPSASKPVQFKLLPKEKIEQLKAIAQTLYEPVYNSREVIKLPETNRFLGSKVILPLIDERYVDMPVIHDLLSDYFEKPFYRELHSNQQAMQTMMILTKSLEPFGHPQAKELIQRVNQLLADYLLTLSEQKGVPPLDFFEQAFKQLFPLTRHYSDCAAEIANPSDLKVRDTFGHLLTRIFLSNTKTYEYNKSAEVVKNLLTTSFHLSSSHNNPQEDDLALHNLLECGKWLISLVPWSMGDAHTEEFHALLLTPCSIVLERLADRQCSLDENTQKALFNYILHLLSDDDTLHYLPLLLNSATASPVLSLLLEKSLPLSEEDQQIASLLSLIVDKDPLSRGWNKHLENVCSLVKAKESQTLYGLAVKYMTEASYNHTDSIIDAYKIIEYISLQVLGFNFLSRETRISQCAQIAAKTLEFQAEKDSKQPFEKKLISEPRVWQLLSEYTCETVLKGASQLAENDPSGMLCLFDHFGTQIKKHAPKIERCYILRFFQLLIHSIAQWEIPSCLTAEHRIVLYAYVFQICVMMASYDEGDENYPLTTPTIKEALCKIGNLLKKEKVKTSDAKHIFLNKMRINDFQLPAEQYAWQLFLENYTSPTSR